ncbi:MAG TPA: YceI family protein [Sphingomonadaceae bacterium]|nr:YceI family protein [Sphingomonadaceae bacterium]
MRKLHLGLAALAGATVLSIAAVNAQNGTLAGPGTADASQVTAGTYTADPGHTLVQWKVNHFGFSDYFGLFGNITGTLELDPANVDAAKLDVTIPVSSVLTASEGLTAHLLRDGADGAAPDFFGSNPEPARFVSTSVRKVGDDQALINGMLTLNGVTKPVAIMAQFTGAGKHPFNQKESVGFKGWGRIKRTDFNVNFGTQVVTDTVDLEIAAAFEK